MNPEKMWGGLSRSMVIRCVLAICLLGGLGLGQGCAGRQDVVRKGEHFESIGSAASTQSSSEPAVAQSDPPVHSISRADYDQMLAAGPSHFMSQVRVLPVHFAGKFAGHRITSLFPGDPRFEQIPVRLGDVVRSINGRVVITAQDFMDCWEDLPNRDELVLEVVRGARILLITWTVE